MVVCRCGCEFENFPMDSYVICPECGRIYPNKAPDMYHPKTEEECRWKCAACGTVNDNSYSGGPRTKCEKCNAARPGYGVDTNKQKNVGKQKILGKFPGKLFKKITK